MASRATIASKLTASPEGVCLSCARREWWPLSFSSFGALAFILPQRYVRVARFC
ncbi:hypothetical protein BD309DRAFT_972025 [Dichomitus squalens]|uniref:Uncharacterized protein n=1 Tax=Dichomitus squalens TaxID=114155 RepID=A0A4V2K2Y6_9APHY|nr:hypothetical protein BD311DRAFT_759356 [Dichomitus squalens]TBU38393.1 hypothetical protein BD309DRAFT_972025 [Dichomitus squalens]